MRRDKSSLTFTPLASVEPKTTSTRVACEANQGYASTFKLTQTDQATMEKILAEVKSVAARVNDIDESVGAHLDTIDRLKEIQALSPPWRVACWLSPTECQTWKSAWRRQKK